jgi:hypothetical protein
MDLPPSGFDLADPGAHPLWREPAFGFTLLAFGLAAALLPIAVSPAPAAWPVAAVVLLALLAVADLGGVAPAVGAASGVRRSVRFAIGAAVLPMWLGLAAAALGMGPGGRVALILLGVGALLSIGSIALLEVAPPPDPDGVPTGTGRATLAAGAALSLATAPFAQPLVDAAAGWLAAEPPAGAWLLAAFALALLCGVLVAAVGWAGGAWLRQLRYRSFRAPRAAAAALLLATSGGIAAAAWAWF